MAPKLEHLLDSSCYSVTYPPSSASELDTTHSPTGTTMSQEHSSPFYELPPYYPGSQQTLSLDQHNASGSTHFSEPDTTGSSPSIGSDYSLATLFPPYYPIPLTDNLGIVPTNPDIFNRSGATRLPRHFPPQVRNALFSTPFKQRMGTSRLPNEQSKITVEKLAQLLHKELESNRVYGANFIPLIFPDRILPIPVGPNLFKELWSAKIWNPSKCELDCKPSSYSENDIAKWLNKLAKGIGKCFGQEVKRSWYAGNKMVSPEGSAIIRKPDVVLLRMADATKIISSHKTPHEEKTQWAMILALGETTAESSFPRRMLDTVDGKSYIVFTTQHDRRFVPALCFDGKGGWSLTITDRQGQLITGTMSLRGQEYVELFLRVFIVLMFGQEMHLGLDPNMIRDSKHHISRILVDGDSYSVRRKIYSLQSLLGRGTQVWIVMKDGRLFIMKDAWIQASRVENENKHLKAIQGIPALKGKVPTFVAGEDVLIEDLPDNTLWYRVGLGYEDEHRVHRRVITSDIGSSITTFTSKAEFIRAMIDIVKILTVLCNDAHILHRDISPNNIMLVRDDDGRVRNVLLIDFDYASTLEMNNNPANINNNPANISNPANIVDHFRTGTPPFMAIEILLEKGKTFCHHLRHDLESVLFVIIWICSHMEGPEVERKDVAGLAVRKWSNMELGLRDLGHIKLAHIEDAKRTLLPEFTSYWEDFKPFVLKLIRAFFPARASEPNCIDPDTMVSILEEAERDVKEPSSSGPSVEPTVVETEMHEYNVLKYGKNYRRGQEEAPRKRIKTTEPSSPSRPSSARTRSSRTGAGPSRTRSSRTRSPRTSAGPSRISLPRASKLRNATSGQSFGATV